MKRTPTSYAVVMLRDAAARGVDLLEGMTVTAAELEASETMPLDDYVELLGRYTALQDDAAWGFRFGEQLTMSAHGALGFGAVSAPTLRDGLLFLSRYLPVRVPYAQSTVEQRAGTLVVRIRHDDIDFLARSCETMASVFQEFIRAAGASVEPLVWRFPYAAPDHVALYAERISGGVYFDHDCWQLEVPRSIGMIPSPFRNEVAYKATMAQCEALLLQSHDDGIAAQVRGMLVGRLDTRLMESVPVTEIPTAAEVADHLGISRRTLIRGLAASGETFQSIRDALTRERLNELLKGDLPLRDIAQRLGFADAANLTRSCRRLLGDTPSNVRKTRR